MCVLKSLEAVRTRLRQWERRGGCANRGGFAYVANCVSRRNALGKLLPDESLAFRAATAEALVFGFYGNGEIGRNSAEEPSAGATHSIGVTVFRTKDEPGGKAPLAP